MTANPIYYFFASRPAASPLLLRLFLAVVFLYHAAQKALGWFNGPGWQRTLEYWTSASGLGLSNALAIAVITAEFVIGALLFFGLFTRISALVVILITGGGLAMLPSQTGPLAVEYALALIVMALAVALMGGGRLSLDRAISSQLLPDVG